MLLQLAAQAIPVIAMLLAAVGTDGRWPHTAPGRGVVGHAVVSDDAALTSLRTATDVAIAGSSGAWGAHTLRAVLVGPPVAVVAFVEVRVAEVGEF